MATYSGPSFFHDVTGVTLTPAGSGGTAIHVYACTGISMQRQKQRLYGYDNNVTRPVASHIIRENDRISIKTEDMNAVIAAYAASGPFTLAFVWQPDAQTTGTQAGIQTVTISNFVLNNTSADGKMQAHSSGSIDGELLGVEAGTDPIVFS